MSFGTFDFGGNGAREEEHNNTLARVMWKGVIQRCRRTLIFVSSIAYSKHLQLIQNGEAYDGLGSCRSDNLTWLQNSSRKTATFIVPSSGWFFLSFGE